MQIWMSYLLLFIQLLGELMITALVFDESASRRALKLRLKSSFVDTATVFPPWFQNKIDTPQKMVKIRLPLHRDPKVF